MQQKFIPGPEGFTEIFEACQGKRLILFFAGWGMDEKPFVSLVKPGYDIMLVYDYRNSMFDMSLLDGYDEICVLAWSLGVWHADRFLVENPQLPITRCIAINGTLNPIDDTEGIPERIYDMTSALPNEAALAKFYRRICGSQSAMEKLMPVLPQRDVNELRDELVAIRRRLKGGRLTDTSRWDEIYLSDSDQIFPFQNMSKAWENAGGRVRVLHGCHHAIDFTEFIDTSFVDKNFVGYRFATSLDTYAREAKVQREVAEKLLEMAEEYFPERRESLKILEIGSGAGLLTSMYDKKIKFSDIDLWDLSTVESYRTSRCNEFYATDCDAEVEFGKLPDESYDMIFSGSTLQWFNSARRFIAEIPRVLRPGGVAILSFYIEGTIPELNRFDDIPRMHYPNVDDMLPSLQGVEYHTRKEMFHEIFSMPRHALEHLRETGVNALNRKPMSVADTRRLMKMLANGFSVLDYNAQFLVIKKHG